MELLSISICVLKLSNLKRCPFQKLVSVHVFRTTEYVLFKALYLIDLAPKKVILQNGIVRFNIFKKWFLEKIWLYHSLQL